MKIKKNGEIVLSGKDITAIDLLLSWASGQDLLYEQRQSIIEFLREWKDLAEWR